jgi:hypothetical protein
MRPSQSGVAHRILEIHRQSRAIHWRAMAAFRTLPMKKTLPDKMFVDPESSRLNMLRNWVLEHQVTTIDMNERQFWNFAALQPLAEKPWPTFMGRLISVSDMPEGAQRHLGIFDKNAPGMI